MSALPRILCCVRQHEWCDCGSGYEDEGCLSLVAEQCPPPPGFSPHPLPLRMEPCLYAISSVTTKSCNYHIVWHSVVEVNDAEGRSRRECVVPLSRPLILTHSFPHSSTCLLHSSLLLVNAACYQRPPLAPFQEPAGGLLPSGIDRVSGWEGDACVCE